MYGKYIVLFAILFTGWFLRRINFIDDKMNHSLNKFIVYFAYPCLIVHNIGTLDLDGKALGKFLLAFVLSLACFYLYGLICYGYAKLRKLPEEDSNIIEFAMAAPNDGFMGFPITLIFFGETGLLYMLAHNAAMNFFCFTYGIKLVRRNCSERRQATPRNMFRAVVKLILNPNILALILGFIISISGLHLPGAVDEYLLYIGNVATPMAMIFIGSTLAKFRFVDIIKSLVTIEASFVKLFLLPAVTLLLLYFLPIDPLIKSLVVLGSCFPSAATVSMLAEQEGQNVGAASKVLFLSTMASIATIPLSINVLLLLFS